MSDTSYLKIINQIGKLIINDIGLQRIVIDFGVNRPIKSNRANGGNREGSEDIFDMLVKKGAADNRDAAIRLCAEKYQSGAVDGKWRELAKWVLKYEQEEQKQRNVLPAIS